MAHHNVPVFIPHLGCPNQCVFCNQRSISGCHDFLESEAEQQIRGALATIPVGDETEIAFFGGSFTGIERGLMLRLLDMAEGFVRRGEASSIRLSTRPDYISREILEILSRYSVGCIELGLQSMSDAVLQASHRGYDAKTAKAACRALSEFGIPWVGQMMIGLPCADARSECETARIICDLGASAARIYPTVVFRDTPLEVKYRSGSYLPLSVEDAAHRSAAVLGIFLENRVSVIRIGLCETENLRNPELAVAGPNHPALGELVWNAYYYDLLVDTLKQSRLLGREVILRVPEREMSKIVGQHRCNLVRLERETDTRVRKIVGEQNIDRLMPQLWQGTGM